MPGFLGIPAGMTTTSTPFKEFPNSAGPVNLEFVLDSCSG